MARNQNILAIRLKSIGDVVLTLPAVSVLRENFPTTKISFLTSAENASLLRGFREVDETITLDRAALRGGHPLRMTGELFRLLCRLRSGRFSLVVDLQGNGESAWLTRITGAAQRWGAIYHGKHRWAFTHTVERLRHIHAAEIHLELLRQGGLKTGKIRNEFILPAEAMEAGRRFFEKQNLTSKKPVMFIQPFTSSPQKNWPLQYYLELAAHWRARGWQVLFSGGPADRAALEPAHTAGFVISAGVPLLVTARLMQLSTLIVGGDTGALHLAVAQGKRVVMLMNHNRSGRPHPFRHPEWSLLPSVDLNIATIRLDSVIGACEAALG